MTQDEALEQAKDLLRGLDQDTPNEQAIWNELFPTLVKNLMERDMPMVIRNKDKEDQ